MSDREWFCVETQDGQAMPVNGMSTEAGNRETAEARCRELAPRYEGPLVVVRYVREELCSMQREISVKETSASSSIVRAT